MKKKVILYNPLAVFFDMPLALLAIGSQLDPQKYEVIIIDARVEKNAHQLVLEACQDAVCLGVTVLTGSPIRDARVLSQKVKARYGDLPIVWGGWHPSLFPTEILEDEQAVDVCVYGQGELSFKDLVAHWSGKQDIGDITGIAYRDKKGNIIKNKARATTDMNSLEGSDYTLIDVEKYFVKKKQRQFDYISSTGCRFRCTFCADPFVYNRGWTGIEPDRMGQEFSRWKKKFQFDDINFQDETFFTKRKRVSEIAEQLISREINASWAGTLRADQGHRLSDEEFDLIKRSGLRRVLVGVESGSQEMMDWLKKDIKIEYVWETARRCAERDISVIFPFIVGFPDESDQSVMDSLQVAQGLNAMHPSFTTPIFYFKPYPGSKITLDVVEQGYKLPQSLEEWANFDYIGSAGPWVSAKKLKLIERFKFYNKVAWRKHSAITRPFQWLAQGRLKKQFYAFPWEKKLVETVMRQKDLS